MADSKITALAALTTADPANDMFPVVDVSDTSMAASGTTKRISINNILACSPSATLASATITGDLTVNTNVLKVDSTNDRVGIGTATPGYDLEIAGAVRSSLAIRGNFAGGTDIAHLRFVNANGSVVADIFSQNTNGGASDSAYLSFNTTSSGTSAERYRIGSDGTSTWSVGGSTAMTLNATGLGLGVSPVTALSFPIGTTKIVAQSAVTAHLAGNAGTMKFGISDGGGDYSGLHVVNSHNGTYSSQDLLFFTGEGGVTLSLERMRVTKSGNLVVGTTSQNGSWNTKLTLSNDSGTTNWAVGPYLGGVTNFLISAGASAGVYLNGTAATSWTSASDERLKDIIEPISNAVSKVASLRAVIGKFKFDENNTRKPFLIAQDIQAVLPEAVDASNPDKLGVAYTDVIPLLVAAIKELTARVQTLEAK